jgi:hypothetical protein
MTPDDVRAAAERLADSHERFAPLFSLSLENVGRILRDPAW